MRQEPVVLAPAWNFAMTVPQDGGLRVRVCGDDAPRAIVCDVLVALAVVPVQIVTFALAVLKVSAGAGANP